MEKLHQLMKQVADELSIHFKKYIKTHEDIINIIHELPDPSDITLDQKNKLKQLLEELLSTWNTLNPAIGYMLQKNEAFHHLGNIHMSLTGDLDMDWFK